MEHITFEQLPNAVGQIFNKLERLEQLLRNQNTTVIEQPEKLLSIQEAADFLNLKVPTIYTKVSRGELPVMKRSNRLYFSQSELLEYLKTGRKKTNDEIAKEVDSYLKSTK